MLGLVTTLRNVTRPSNFDVTYSGGFETSGDILGHHFLPESLSEHIAKFLPD
jgi:hypothetical protein